MAFAYFAFFCAPFIANNWLKFNAFENEEEETRQTLF